MVGVCGVWAVLPTGAMAALRDLIGVRNCERDEYYVYCQVCRSRHTSAHTAGGES